MKKISQETRTAYETCRTMAMEHAQRIADAAGVVTLPLDLVAPLLPVQPEWLEYMSRRKPTKGHR